MGNGGCAVGKADVTGGVCEIVTDCIAGVVGKADGTGRATGCGHGIGRGAGGREEPEADG